MARCDDAEPVADEAPTLNNRALDHRGVHPGGSLRYGQGMANSTYNPSQPNGTGINPGPTPTQQPQKTSTRLSQGEVTQGGPLPFTQPPVRKGNPSGLSGVPFKLNGAK